MGVVALVLLASLGARAAEQDGDVHNVRLEAQHLTLTLPALEGLASAGTNRWQGHLGAARVEIVFKALSRERYAFAEPDDVLDSGPSFWSAPDQARIAPPERHALSGRFGYAAWAAWEESPMVARDGTTAVGQRWILGGLLEDAGYWITVEATPPPDAAGAATLRAFVTGGVAYDGPVRDHRWSDEEVRARWQRDAPEAIAGEMEKPVRTAHYIVLSNTSAGGKSFASKMEGCYAAIRKVYPFVEVPERRLLPVFLFKTADQYIDYYVKVAGETREGAARSKGHAWHDYYATWYDAPGDPVHIHEATHQIFSNRLGLGGGGSWFQEGVAEYMSTKPGDRSAAAGEVRRGAHVPLAQLVTIESLLMSSSADAKEGDRASGNYAEAAVLIEFLRESKWAKDKFPEFLRRIGSLPGGNRDAIETEIRALYGVDLAGLEERWAEYCKKR